MVNFEYRQFPQGSDGVRQDLQQVLGQVQISERLQPLELGQELQFVLRDVKAGEFSQSIDLVGQTGELVVIQPQL